jgi:hypothetical protein
MKKLMFRIQKRIQKKLRVSEIEAKKRTTALIIHIAVALSICLHAILCAYLILVEDSFDFDKKVSWSVLLLFFFSFFSFCSFRFFIVTGQRDFTTRLPMKKGKMPSKVISIFRSRGYLYYD